MTDMTTNRTTDYENALGIRFQDSDLLLTALTHRSFVHENRNRIPDLQHNERLEFLGDAVLEFISGEWLYQQFPDMREGELTRIRAALVRTETLADFARDCGIDDLIRLGPGEESNGGRTRNSILCDAFEAVIGALYLDQGLDEARSFIVSQFEPALELILQRVSTKDAKSRFQEWCHKEYDDTVPDYWVIAALGPAHDRQFMVEVQLVDEAVGWGSGRSIRTAQQAAAEMALKELGIDGQPDGG